MAPKFVHQPNVGHSGFTSGPIVTALVTNPRLNIPNDLHQTLYQGLFEAHILDLRTWNTGGTCV